MSLLTYFVTFTSEDKEHCAYLVYEYFLSIKKTRLQLTTVTSLKVMSTQYHYAYHTIPATSLERSYGATFYIMFSHALT